MMSEALPAGNPALLARRLLRRVGRAALATSLRGRPFASLVLLVADSDASPLLLLSDLAEHSRNIGFDPRVSVLVDGTEGHPDPLAGPRLTLIGQAQIGDDPRRLARFTAHHPASTVYSGFADFHLYRVTVERGHLVAGFGRIYWIEPGDLLFTGDAGELAAAEPEILRQMNEDHAAAIVDVARRSGGGVGAGWQMTGIDPEGIDLRRGAETARCDFGTPVRTPEEARAALVKLAAEAQE